MGAASSMSGAVTPSTEPIQKLRKMSGIAGVSVAHAKAVKEKMPLPESPSGAKVHQPGYPRADSNGSATSVPTSPAEPLILSSEAEALLNLVQRQDHGELTFLREFCLEFERSQGKDFPPSMFALLHNCTLSVMQVALQRVLCEGSVVSVRLTLSGLGLLTMRVAFLEEQTSHSSHFLLLLREYLEFSLAKLYAVSYNSVAVARIKPGNVTVTCCFETNQGKWTTRAKTILRKKLGQRELDLKSNCSRIFGASGKSARDKRISPATYASRVLQRAVRKWLAEKPAKVAVERLTPGDDDARPRTSDCTVAPQPTRLGRAESMRFDVKMHSALDPWWQKVNKDSRLSSEDLEEFGIAVAKALQTYDLPVFLFHNKSVKVRSARYITPTVKALNNAGLEVSGDDSENSVQDEFSDVMPATHLEAVDSGEQIWPSTAVVMLRLHGLAAVSGRDFFADTFDDGVVSMVRQVVAVPGSINVRLLGKKFGSVVIFVGIDTIHTKSNDPLR